MRRRKGYERPTSEKKVLHCISCHRKTQVVDSDVKIFRCSYCCDMDDPFVQQVLSKENDKKDGKKEEVKVTTRKARGWKFMKEFVDSEGNVFHRGIEQPNLKGTRPRTEIKKKELISKINMRVFSEKQAEAFAKINEYKNLIISAYQEKRTTVAHKLERELSAYKRENKKFLK